VITLPSQPRLTEVLYILYTLYIHIMKIRSPRITNRCKIVHTWLSLLATDRPALSSERTPYKYKTVNVQTKTTIWSWAADKTLHQDKLTISHNDTMAGSVMAPTGGPTSCNAATGWACCTSQRKRG
jgi:hypothetical protein